MTELNITPELAHKLVATQFPKYADLPVTSVAKQGHDNRTYRLGDNLLIRMPTAESYALKVPKEQELLPRLAKHLSVEIPEPILMGTPSADYPYPFSIYKWIGGESANQLDINDKTLETIAEQLATFLKELQSIKDVDGPAPGQHNWWRGDHVSVYDSGTREQIAKLSGIIDTERALQLWEQACSTKWSESPVWVHGDFASGNILIQNGKLIGVIDFGGMGVGDPACDLVIAWTFLKGKSREVFQQAIPLDADTWLRAKAWALWKATFELCKITDKESNEEEYSRQMRIVQEVIEI